MQRPSMPRFPVLVSALLMGIILGPAGGFGAAPQQDPHLRQRATDARLAGRLDEAVTAYQAALKASPAWAEGWYFLGSIHYELDRGPECASAFSRFVQLQPKSAAGHAFLGLCQYQAGQYPGALQSLSRAEALGLKRDDPLTDVASYHAAVLYNKDKQFERALRILEVFLRRETVNPKVIELTGLATLRMAIFPADLTDARRDLVVRTGEAVMKAGDRRPAEAAQQFQDLIRDYPQQPNLHFAYGNLLLASDPAAALAQFEAERKLQPDHLPARIVAGLELLRQSRFAEARQMGEEAVRLGPRNFTAHLVLGRALSEGDLDVAAGVLELEAAVKQEPGSPQVRLALANAYAKAGRREDAAKQRAEFTRLKQLMEGPAVGAGRK